MQNLVPLKTVTWAAAAKSKSVRTSVLVTIVNMSGSIIKNKNVRTPARRSLVALTHVSTSTVVSKTKAMSVGSKIAKMIV